jgi:hypothetical protein
MFWLAIAGWVALLAVCVGFAVQDPIPETRNRRSSRLARRYRMYVEPDDRPAFDLLLDRERDAQSAFLTSTVAVLGAGAITLTTPIPDAVILLVGFAAVILLGWAAALVEAAAPGRTPGPGPSNAPVRTTTAEFVHPAVRAAFGIAALAGLAVAFWAITRPSQGTEWTTIAFALAPVCGFVASELGSHLVARMPLPAGRVGWRYAVLAMRSESITIAYSSTVALEFLPLSHALAHQDAFEVAGVLIVMVLVSIGSAAPTMSHLRFRTRLWPQLPRHAIVHTSAERLPW